MQVSTTNGFEDQKIREYKGLVSGEAVVGVDIDYETVGQGGGMMMVTACGTAVVVS